MSSNNESAESNDSCRSGKADEVAKYDLKYVNRLNKTRLERLKSLQKNLNCKNEKERVEFLRHLYPLIGDWKEQLPKLRVYFRPKEIESLLTDSLKHISKGRHKKGRFIDFVIRTGYTDEPKVDEDGRPLLRRTTVVHYAATLVGDVGIVENLFNIYDKFDANYTDQSGLSHFHVACRYGRLEVVEKFLELGQNPDCIWTETGDTPLHVALDWGCKEVAELLLRQGANPNLVNDKRVSILHIICKRFGDRDDLLNTVFEICSERHQPLSIDARDELGDTALNLALFFKKRQMVELLLKRGANPNLANEKGQTALHFVSSRDAFFADNIASMLFELSDERHQPLQINAADNMGNTPLHIALKEDNKNVAEFFMRKGADLNLVNVDGLTPLHIICYCDHDVDLVKMFFEVNDDKSQLVKLDLVDELGLTPLQSAVASLLPDVVDVLLERTVDLSNFVFPDESQFEERLMHWSKYCYLYTFKLRQASRILLIVERLESSKKGYKLNRDSAFTIMQLLDQNRCLESASGDEYWYKCDEFARKATEIMMRDNDPNLSLYDLIRLSPEEAAKHVTYSDYFQFAHSQKLNELPKKFIIPCVAHLCEKISKVFFWRWTLEFCPPAID